MKLILLTTILLVSANLNAQNTNTMRLSYDFGLSSCKDVSFTDSYNDGRSLYAPSFGFNLYSQVEGVLWFSTGLNYFQVGDVYNYFTGINYEKTDVRIFVNTLKMPAYLSVFFEKGKRVNLLVKAGPSFDFIFGESTIKPEKSLNNPDGFRRNISQGKVGKRLFLPLNLAAGLSFKSKEGKMNSYLEILFYGKARDIFDDPTGSKSSYNNISLRYGVFINK